MADAKNPDILDIQTIIKLWNEKNFFAAAKHQYDTMLRDQICESCIELNGRATDGRLFDCFLMERAWQIFSGEYSSAFLFREGDDVLAKNFLIEVARNQENEFTQRKMALRLLNMQSGLLTTQEYIILRPIAENFGLVQKTAIGRHLY